MTNSEKRAQGIPSNVLKLPTKPEVKAEIIIQLLATGQVQVTFPIGRARLCAEMLREAANTIRTHEQGEGGIILPGQKAIIEI